MFCPVRLLSHQCSPLNLWRAGLASCLGHRSGPESYSSRGVPSAMINTIMATSPQSPAVTQALGHGRVDSGPMQWPARNCPGPASHCGQTVCLGGTEGDAGQLWSCSSAGLTSLHARRLAHTHSTASGGRSALRKGVPGWVDLEPRPGSLGHLPSPSGAATGPTGRFSLVPHKEMLVCC